MKRFVFDSSVNSFVYKDWIPPFPVNDGDSCTQKKKYIPTSARINNKEVEGTSRVALYTFPDGKDSGVRLNPLYEINGLDVTEIQSITNHLKVAQRKAEEMVKDEFDKGVEKAVKAANALKSSSSNTGSSEGTFSE